MQEGRNELEELGIAKRPNVVDCPALPSLVRGPVLLEELVRPLNLVELVYPLDLSFCVSVRSLSVGQGLEQLWL